MDFSTVQPDDCMHTVSMTVSEDLRERVRELYLGMYQRSEEINGVMPNVVLAGLTLLWLESVHTVFGTADYESAVRLLKKIRPNDKVVTGEMRMAARDMLRRSGWTTKKKRGT